MDFEDQGRVILIGGDHHNGLGLVRSFGRHGIRPYGIIVEENVERGFIRKSRYWGKTWAVKDDDDAVRFLMENLSREKGEKVLIPYSDGAAAAIDSHLNELSRDFIVPSINGEQGKIVSLMNKQKQVEFCRKYGIEILESQIMPIGGKIDDSPVGYPVILKPVASIEGEKLDIRICENKDEFQSSIKELGGKAYQRVLAQFYLTDRVEYVLIGAVTRTLETATVVSNVRQWPANMGCGSFSKFETAENVTRYGEKLLDILQQAGYEGLVDIEYFQDRQGNFYLNEINWRSSGRNFVSLYTGVYPAYLYYRCVSGYPVVDKDFNTKDGFTMNEATDFRHVVYGKLSLRQWWKDLRRTQSFAIWDRQDLRPVVARYGYLAKEMVRRALRRRK